MALQKLVSGIAPLDQAAMAAARSRQESLTKPSGSLGRLEELSTQLAGITGRPQPRIEHKVVVVMAGDHGVAAEGVSAFPQAVTAQMVTNFLHGGAAINVLARQVGARVVIVDVGMATSLASHPGLVQARIAPGTGNIALGPAMSREQAFQSLETGASVVAAEIERGMDILGVGDMGIGNTTPAAAVATTMIGCPPIEIVGRGTGVDDAGLARKVAAVQRALAVNRPDPADPLDVLARVGGLEIGAMAGAMLAAAGQRRPVMVDGFISTAAAMIAIELAPQVRPYFIAAHQSKERGHRLMLEWLGSKPLLDLELRLGEGSGAALGIFLAEASCRLLAQMATFAEARVAGKGPS